MPTEFDGEAYQDDFSYGRVEVGGDGVFTLDGSVDGQGGELRDLPVFTAEEAAFYLNRGSGLQLFDGVYYGSGANWAGAQGTANNQWYFLPTAHTNGGEANDGATQYQLTGNPNAGPTGPLTDLNFGFYETLATLPDPYVFTRASDGNNNLYVGDSRALGFSTFDADQRDAARQAISAWDELINVTFHETNFAQGDINYMNTTTGPIQASAFLPYGSSTSSVIVQDDGTRVTTYERVGDVFVNPTQASNHLFDEGQYGLTTLIHETGHSLGLEHPGAYNFGPGFEVTYENGAEYYQDSRQYTIMSYWDAEETGASHVDWNLLTYRYASTPGVHDIAAIQRIYGADMTTRAGNDTYGFNVNLSTHGLNDESYDFVATPTPVIAIWDGGGIDTLDLSGYNTPSVIDLNPGAFSSAGGFLSATIPTLAEINARRAALGLAPRDQATYDVYVQEFGDSYGNGVMRDNIAIAYNVTIENAVGGAGDDTITGNTVANILTGNGGNDVLKGMDGDDTLVGGLGNDSLDGGAGIDTATYAAASAGVTVNLGAGTATGADGNDTLTAVENVIGSAFADTLSGDAGANRLDGAAGTDTVSYANATGSVNVNLGAGSATGAAGNDTLVSIENVTGSGFNDTLAGNSGANVIDGGAGADTVSYADASGTVSVNLTAGTATGAAGSDTLVSIENAIGSAYNDSFIGNAGANAINGGAGVDTMSYGNASGGVNVNLATGVVSGAAGADTLSAIENVIGSKFQDRIVGDSGANRIQAGDGIDVVTLGAGNDVFVAEQGTKVSTKAGSLSWDIITDFNGNGDLIDLSGLGSFHWDGSSANKDAGDITFKVYTSITGAENALGIDIHSQPGASGITGPVTVVFGNDANGGSADFALVLLNTNGVDQNDFIWTHETGTASALASLNGPVNINADYMFA